MIGTIEELEREIEQFQSNMAASGEMVSLCRQLLDQIKSQNDDFGQKYGDLVNRSEQIHKNIIASNDEVKTEIDSLLKERNDEFIEEQEKYLSALRETQNTVVEGGKKLDESFDDFIDVLKKVNISNLYKQNIKLNKGLNIKIIILGVVSIISLIISIIGLFI